MVSVLPYLQFLSFDREDYILLITVEGLWRIRGMELFCICLQTWDHVLDLGFFSFEGRHLVFFLALSLYLNNHHMN